MAKRSTDICFAEQSDILRMRTVHLTIFLSHFGSEGASFQRDRPKANVKKFRVMNGIECINDNSADPML
jgi:hypothetical protein